MAPEYGGIILVSIVGIIIYLIIRSTKIKK